MECRKCSYNNRFNETDKCAYCGEICWNNPPDLESTKIRFKNMCYRFGFVVERMENNSDAFWADVQVNQKGTGNVFLKFAEINDLNLWNVLLSPDKHGCLRVVYQQLKSGYKQTFYLEMTEIDELDFGL